MIADSAIETLYMLVKSVAVVEVSSLLLNAVHLCILMGAMVLIDIWCMIRENMAPVT